MVESATKQPTEQASNSPATSRGTDGTEQHRLAHRLDIAFITGLFVVLGLPPLLSNAVGMNTLTAALLSLALALGLPGATVAYNRAKTATPAPPSRDPETVTPDEPAEEISLREETTIATHTLQDGDTTIELAAPATLPTDRTVAKLTGVIEGLPTGGDRNPITTSTAVHAITYESNNNTDIHVTITAPEANMDAIVEESIRALDNSLHGYSRKD